MVVADVHPKARALTSTDSKRFPGAASPDLLVWAKGQQLPIVSSGCPQYISATLSIAQDCCPSLPPMIEGELHVGSFSDRLYRRKIR